MSRPIRVSSVVARRLGAKPLVAVPYPFDLPDLVLIEGWPHLIILDERCTPWAWPVEYPQR